MPGLGVTTTTNLFLFFSRIIGHSNVIPSRRERRKVIVFCSENCQYVVRRTHHHLFSLLTSSSRSVFDLEEEERMEDDAMATVEELFIVSSDEDEDVPQSSSSSSLLPLDKDVMAAITNLENDGIIIFETHSTPDDGETTTVDGGTEANGNNNNDNEHNQHCVLESLSSTANPTTIIESSKVGEITRLENRISELEDRLSVVISQLVHFSNHSTTNIKLTPPINSK